MSLVNQTELAAILGTTDVSLWQWAREGMPVLEQGERGQPNVYDTVAVIQWKLERALAKAQVSKPRDDLDRVRTQREQLALAREQGELVDRSELRPAMDRYVDDVIGVIEACPDKYAPLLQQLPDVDGKHQLLREMIREIREVLGGYEFADD
jgi:hypothetical protein